VKCCPARHALACRLECGQQRTARGKTKERTAAEMLSAVKNVEGTLSAQLKVVSKTDEPEE
jgi:hypothetical protein